MKRNHKIKFFLLVIGLMVVNTCTYAAGFDYTPTILQVNKNNQNDTVGFNLVTSAYELFYNKIVSDEITLWDSPAKKVKISSSAFLQMEAQSGLNFKQSEDLFIYEYWKLFKKKFEFEVIGFSFYARNQLNEKINYGYIDGNEAKSVLSLELIEANINGSSTLNYWQAILSKDYQFNIAKFGAIDLVKNPSKALEIKEGIFNSKKIKTNRYKIPPVKEVSYFVYPTTNDASGSYWICKSIENFYNKNRLVYSQENEQEVDLNDTSRLIVTRVEVTETWIKDCRDERISYIPTHIQVFINRKPLKLLELSKMDEKNILVQFKPLREFLRDKNFKYTIKRVNSEPIYGHEADEIKAALREQQWNKIKYTEPNLLKTLK